MTADPTWFSTIEALGSLPPVARWNPPFCGDSRMHIARDGGWFHDGAPILRPGLARLFAGLLRKEAQGYMLVTPAEKLSIRVEDVPFIATGLTRQDDVLGFVTNMGDAAALTPDAGWRLADDGRGAAIPYVAVRDGLEARIARSVYYQLADCAVERDGRMGLVSGGHFFALELD